MAYEEHPVCRRIRVWLNDPKASADEYAARKEAVRSLNSRLGVMKVVEAVAKQNDQPYADLIDNWGKPA